MSQLSVVRLRRAQSSRGLLQENGKGYSAEPKGDVGMIITPYVLSSCRYAVNEVNPQRTTDAIRLLNQEHGGATPTKG
ncbi:MAG: hypothetical protein P8075_15695 [Deltaproteobacteria bacterium]|jgi:hypothetical protein